MAQLPRFENTWTFGNTLTLLLMIIGGAGIYSDINASIRVQEQAVIQYREDLAEIRASASDNDGRIRALELGAGRIEEKLLSIDAALSRIEVALKEGRASE